MGSFFGVEGEPSDDDLARAFTAKDVIAEGLLRAIAGGVATDTAAALVDATYGAGAIETLRAAGVRIAVPVEASGRAELAFEHGDWRDRLDVLDPTWAKVLVRYNPAGDAIMNARQLERLVELHDHCAATERPLMLELLVPPEPAQAGSAFDKGVRPGLVVDAIGAIRGAGATPALWKLEGFTEKRDAVAAAAAAGAPCVVLGRGQDPAAVDRWIRIASGVEGFVGFAIGRSIWWDALRRFIAGDSGRDETADAIAAAFARTVAVDDEAVAGSATT